MIINRYKLYFKCKLNINFYKNIIKINIGNTFLNRFKSIGYYS